MATTSVQRLIMEMRDKALYKCMDEGLDGAMCGIGIDAVFRKAGLIHSGKGKYSERKTKPKGGWLAKYNRNSVAWKGRGYTGTLDRSRTRGVKLAHQALKKINSNLKKMR